MPWSRLPDRKLSRCLPSDGPSAPPRILRPPEPESPWSLCAGDPLPFRADSLLSAGTFRSLSIVLVRVLSAMPKVPLLRAILFFASGLEACRELSSLLRARTARPASVLRVGLSDVSGEIATRGGGEMVLLRVVLPPREDVGLFAALPTVFREVMGLL